MHYAHTSPKDISPDSAENAKILRKRLDGFLAKEKELVVQQAADPYAWEPKRDLLVTRQAIAKLEREVRLQEGNAGITHRNTEADLPAYGAGASVWRRDI
jgi:hypothetical protein